MMVAGCNDASSDGEDCVSDEEFFQERVYANVLATKCMSCHTDSGAAKDSEFILKPPEWGPDYLERNLEVFSQMAKLEFEGTPWVLLKPTAQLEHGGAEQFKVDSEEYEAIEEMIARLDNPTVCEDEGNLTEEFFEGVEMLDEVATLRKATLSLVGRLPTIEEEQRVRDGGFEALDAVLDEVMEEEAFYQRIKEIYNDHFLTDRYYRPSPSTIAIDLLDDEDYPNKYWFDALPEDQIDEAMLFSNNAVAREPLELVSFVVRNELPFTEILTADYTVVNPYSAKVFGVSPDFQDPNDPGEFVKAKIPGVPHAGVMTSTVFLTRFPTTSTNRNRHRARMLYEFFLATDVQALGDRPVDATAIAEHNPTMNNPNCTLCHTIIDPVAGSFMNWNEMGAYRPVGHPQRTSEDPAAGLDIPQGGWYSDMLPPGFGEVEMPSGMGQSALSWLASEVVKDQRFGLSAVYIMFKGLSGQDPLKEPTDPKAAGYLEGIRAAKVQREIFNDIATKFAESDYNLKTIVKEIVKTPYYRAHDATGLDEQRQVELEEVGTGRLLTPEQLNRKILATTGLPWRGSVDEEQDHLMNFDEYRIFYGGIDSDEVIERITEPNGIMSNVAKRMANEMACLSVGQDFAKPPEDRMMFPLVERDFSPEDANGFEVPAAAQAIRANIQYLHQRLLGEYLDINDPEINRTYELFLEVWKDGQGGLASGEYDAAVPGPCQATFDYWTGEEYGEQRAVVSDGNYTVRAWMAVTSYLLSDYRFLHE